MEDKCFTIDDVFLLADAMTKKLHELGNQKGIEEKIATVMLNASDPDSAFKADIAMKISTVMSLIEMLITYINKPVVAEGIMQWKMDGSVMIGVNPVPIGSLVELRFTIFKI